MGWWSRNFGQEKKWNQAISGRVEYAKRKPKKHRKKYYSAEDKEDMAEAKAAARDEKKTAKARRKFGGTIAKLERKGTKVAKLLGSITIEKDLAELGVVEGKVRSHMINVRGLPAVFRNVLVHIRELRADPVNYLGEGSQTKVVQVERDVHAAIKSMDAIDLVYMELVELGKTADGMRKELERVRKAAKPFKAVDAEMRGLYASFIEPKVGRKAPRSEVPKGQRFA
tara:strand:+ start:1383 stop:2060 length:678 start_codon:yes stop_codon:yes gene_type:complete